MIDYFKTTDSRTKKPLIIYLDEIESLDYCGTNTTKIKTRNGVFYAAESKGAIKAKIETADSQNKKRE